ncbi:cell division topological specificity factor MinE [Helicobacter hepaticus]|jgi:cell division topological specificity factor|uniref:Cell division topological specificity factor n=1 Tax=Helicobacter hepaticus (strain ATCC 51449 / 3B1) TaxID=235279 RepID=MINE_HELHP|nr:cell division topological specificity factor MinE [Helicobacter hepaticus]Q7VGU6.1 RecName: Full=Cell division topological specificity factor [Helicobacter hepaticus ATCC 51449]AAP77821.1 bacterial cell division topological specificity factor MinE [Helicobacter hepaticus ATCC 51449]
MSLLGMFGHSSQKSATLARERLKLVLSHERTANIPYLEDMQKEILQVVQKYTRSSKIEFSTNSNQNINTLEVEITLGN